MRQASRIRIRLLRAVGFVLCLAACSGSDEPGAHPQAGDQPVTVSTSALTLAGISATKAGNYSLVGSTFTLGDNTNYRAGNINTANGSGGTDDWRRGYVVFDLSAVNGTITGASVSLGNTSNNGSNPQTLSLWPVAPGNIANLGVGGTASTLYTDLGDAAGGSGSAAYYSAALASVTANPEPDANGFALGGGAVSDLTTAKSSASKLFAVGVSYYEGATNDRYVFNDIKTSALLILTVNNRSAGQTCSANSDCSSGACAGGFCCSGACSGANGSASCTAGAGTCSVVCNAGYADCTGGAADGCETNLNSPATCGTTCTNKVSCDDANACTADQCSSGTCRHPAGNAGSTCRSASGACDAAEVCPAALAPSNVDATVYSDFGAAPSWTCSTSTTLSAAVDNAVTSIPVASTSGFTTTSGAIIVDNEIMFVSSATATSFTVTRAQLGTTAAAHGSSAVVGGVSVIDSTGATGACPAVTRDTCGGSIALSACTNNVAQLDTTGPNVMIVRLSGISLGNGHAIKLTGDKPIVFLVKGDVSLDTGARIDAGAIGTTAGPGGSIAGQCTGQTGGNGTSASTTGGGGGGFGMAGGAGGRLGANAAGSAGGASTDSDLQPLRGGCSGGVGGNGAGGNGAPGAGGGAFQISASGTITIGSGSNSAMLSAGGGGGLASTSNNIASGGGGSGGAILLESPSLAAFGTNAAARVHGGASGAPRNSATGTAGEGGRAIDNTPAAGGVAGSGAPNGATGGVCAGSGCATASASGTAGTASANVAAGGGGGGGRVVVQSASSGSGLGSATCPADGYATNSTVCRPAAAGGCDVAENCTGTSSACPADTFQPNGTMCRAVAGACDAAETCSGTSNACPTDAFAASGTTCRSIAGVCDPVAEACTGSSAACPADTYAASTTVCRTSTTTCDATEYCTGSSTACPADGYSSSSTVCRAPAGTCDLAENCTGSSNTCPSDTLATAGTVCRAAAGTCDAVETCSGSSTTCPSDGFLPNTTMCRNRGGSTCDGADYCTGSAVSCPDGFAAQGSDCAYATSATTIWASGAPTNTTDRTTSDWTTTTASELAAASAPGDWGSNVIQFVTSSSSTSNSNRYIYQKFASSTYTPASSDYLEYDVYLDDNAGAIGGLEVKDSTGYWSGLGSLDQNSVGFSPTSDLSSRAYHTWYHRRFAVPRTSTVSYLDVVTERDAASTTSTAYYDNIMFTKKLGACDGAGACKLKDGVACAGNNDCAGGLCAGNACVTPQAPGAACANNVQCLSGFCTDNVCCSTACGSNATDCVACSIAAGGQVDGTCVTAAAGTVCRVAANACDVAESCDGTSTVCPDDITL